MFVACEDEKDDEPTLDITISSGTTPTISWSANQVLKDISDPTRGNISHLSIIWEQEGYTYFAWSIRDDRSCGSLLCDNNNISSPVTYGVTPSGVSDISLSIDTLVEGQKYEFVLSVEIISGKGELEQFSKDFTP